MCFEFVVKCQVNGLPSTQTKLNVLTTCKASSPACAATGEIKAGKGEQLADLQQMPSQFICDEGELFLSTGDVFSTSAWQFAWLLFTTYYPDSLRSNIISSGKVFYLILCRT